MAFALEGSRKKHVGYDMSIGIAESLRGPGVGVVGDGVSVRVIKGYTSPSFILHVFHRKHTDITSARRWSPLQGRSRSREEQTNMPSKKRPALLYNGTSMYGGH